MSIFSKIKDIGTSAAVLTRLYGKTWDLLESESRISFIFKSNKEVHYLINGKSSIEKYDFIPNSRTLIIYYSDQGGTSHHLKFVDENALILKGEDNGQDLCFSNRGSNNAPKSKAEAYKFYFANQIEYIRTHNEYYKQYTSVEMTNDVDKVVGGLDDDDKIRLVDTLRKYLPGFDTEYFSYLGYYCQTHDPKYEELYIKIIGTDFVHKTKSETLDYYIEKTGAFSAMYKNLRNDF